MQCEKVILPRDNFWEDNFFALLVLSSCRSGGSSLGFRVGSLSKTSQLFYYQNKDLQRESSSELLLTARKVAESNIPCYPLFRPS